MLDKLNSIEANYEELMGLLASPSVQSNPSEYRKHSKALSDMQPLVERFREYKTVVKEAAQAEELAKSGDADMRELAVDRKSTRLNSSHRTISYAVFCLKKK